MLENLDLSEIRKMAEQDAEETPVVGGSDWMQNTTPVEEESKPNTESYDGPGLVVTNEELIEANKEEELPTYTGVTPETQEAVDKYLSEMDDTIEELKEEHDAIVEKMESEDDEDEDENDMTKDEFDREYNEAVVIIDKSGMGSVINFTDDEREKLEKVKKIRLEEVETISLESIKKKKLKKNMKLDKIIKNVGNIHSTKVVLPVSGYTATMKGCSAYELVSLIDDGSNPLLSAQNKWSLIHSKIESTSIGDMDFNDFLLNTAANDYNSLIYGILCATYPDDDTLPLTCEKCGTTFEHKYSVKSLIRVEKMSDELRDAIMKIVDSSINEDAARKVHEESPIKQSHTVKLPVSGFIVEIYVQSAYDLINKSIKSINENKDERYRAASILSTVINKLYIPDPEDGEYFEISDATQITKAIYTLTETDILVINKIGENLIGDLTIEYGLMDINCPKCKHYTPTYEMDLENILFYKYRQAMSTTIE